MAALAVGIGVPVLITVIAAATISILDRSEGRITTSGETREYLLHVPARYDARRPMPLVLSMHAGGTWPAQQMHLSRWNRLADESGFLVIYPAGTPQLLGVARTWRTFGHGPSPGPDVQYISDLLDEVESKYNIDPSRIYATGMSNGAGLAFVLACRLSGRIAAVGLVAPAQSLPPDGCRPTRPVPVMVFHGDADPIVPYQGGRLGDPLNPVKPLLPRIESFVSEWARRNGCSSADPRVTTVASDVERLEYPGCARDAAVILYTVKGGGHTWPGGKPLPKWWVGPTTTSIAATAEFWRFFLEHPLGS